MRAAQARPAEALMDLEEVGSREAAIGYTLHAVLWRAAAAPECMALGDHERDARWRTKPSSSHAIAVADRPGSRCARSRWCTRTSGSNSSEEAVAVLNDSPCSWSTPARSLTLVARCVAPAAGPRPEHHSERDFSSRTIEAQTPWQNALEPSSPPQDPPPQHPAQRARNPDRERAPRRPARRRRSVQPRHRPNPVRDRQDSRDPPAPHLPEARHQLARPARGSARHLTRPTGIFRERCGPYGPRAQDQGPGSVTSWTRIATARCRLPDTVQHPANAPRADQVTITAIRGAALPDQGAPPTIGDPMRAIKLVSMPFALALIGAGLLLPGAAQATTPSATLHLSSKLFPTGAPAADGVQAPFRLHRAGRSS